MIYILCSEQKEILYVDSSYEKMCKIASFLSYDDNNYILKIKNGFIDSKINLKDIDNYNTSKKNNISVTKTNYEFYKNKISQLFDIIEKKINFEKNDILKSNIISKIAYYIHNILYEKIKYWQFYNEKFIMDVYNYFNCLKLKNKINLINNNNLNKINDNELIDIKIDSTFNKKSDITNNVEIQINGYDNYDKYINYTYKDIILSNDFKNII